MSTAQSLSVVGCQSRSACSVHMALRFTRECATPLHVHPTSTYVTARDKFYQAFPHISTASDKRWGEKAWEQCRAHSVLGTLYTCTCWIMNILTRTNHDYEYMSTVHVTRNDYSTTV